MARLAARSHDEAAPRLAQQRGGFGSMSGKLKQLSSLAPQIGPAPGARGRAIAVCLAIAPQTNCLIHGGNVEIAPETFFKVSEPDPRDA